MALFDDAGRPKYTEPQTFRDRVAYAIAAHDIQGCEGRLEDDELEGLGMLIRAVERRCGSTKAVAGFLGVPQKAVERYYWAVWRLARDDRTLRDPDDQAIARAEVTMLSWPDYRRVADAAVSVLIEDPRAGKQMMRDGEPTDPNTGRST
ncbi:MAG: hypothetical protein U5L06_00715 [Rhodovibrio sp.]|nr:hypothetical protein [Rhodovibrio sp.]